LNLVIDTHVWLWWIGGPGCPALSETARAHIAATDHVGVSAVSCVEIAWLVAHGRLTLDRPPATWLEHAAALATKDQAIRAFSGVETVW